MSIFSTGKWLNAPSEWTLSENELCATTDHKTDFWRETHYGFYRDNGHFFGCEAPLEFTAILRFEGEYKNLYDQAGLMLRVDDRNWLKFGIEHSDGVTNFSTVVTREKSDWSVIPQPLVAGSQTIRLTRRNGAIITHFLAASGNWQLMRVADFPNCPAQIGPMTCSPERAGLKISFHSLTLSPPIDNALHG